MDRNFLLAVVLSMLVVMFWSSSRQPSETSTESSPEVAAEGERAPSGSLVGPQSDASGGETRVAERRASPEALEQRGEPAFEPWVRTIEGAQFVAELSNRGGTLIRYALRDYETAASEGPPEPIDLIDSPAGGLQVGATPFEELGIGNLREAQFEVEEQDSRSVTFALTRDGITVRKHYRFDLDAYTFEFSVAVENMSGELLRPRFEIEWPVAIREGNDYANLSLVTRHDGEVDRTPVGSVGSSGFLGFGADDGKPKTGGIEWFGVDATYFVGALAPQRGSDALVSSVALRKGEIAANVLSFAGIMLPSGNRITQELRGYIGPKLEQELADFGADLTTSVDRGWSWVQPLTRFFGWLLRALYEFIPNYGWVIIVVTFLVRVVTLPIVQKQMKSMERMRALQPRMKEIQKKFADDKEKQSQATMALYKEEGVNPLGGCLPMLLQLPVFIGLFYALRSSIELRHAPFIFWMTDLSAPDQLFLIPGIELPLRVLPLLMAGSMVLQAKFQPMSPDPAQAQMMTTVMPIMMLVLFYQFPSGLVLYYMLSNFLGIAHQRWVGRNMNKAKEA
ncbi:MAG: membrane protein insertase YidC [Myxococcota bacterium]|nr:membrane protein insertase YidC [Myxococcota bacterium]